MENSSVVKSSKKRKDNITVTISFKNNITDKMMYEWLEMRSEIVGKSGYIKNLIKIDMEKSNHSY